MKPEVEMWAEAVFAENPNFQNAPILASNPFTDTVYKSNAGEIGLLSQNESKSVGEFYALVSWYDDILTRIRRGEDVPDHLTFVMLKRLPLLLNKLNLALGTIEQNLDDVDTGTREYVEFENDGQMDKQIERFDVSKFDTITPSPGWELGKD